MSASRSAELKGVEERSFSRSFRWLRRGARWRKEGGTALELSFPGTVSCADILAAATSDLVTMVGGPYYGVLLGRKDYRVFAGLSSLVLSVWFFPIVILQVSVCVRERSVELIVVGNLCGVADRLEASPVW
ncbi:hypothetical protein Tsubulata_045852 [Turnera subulata]|uniref:peroxidase n=1 Tax=Turnera subulata TaxID=218843 RepID=A0A9Q0JI30_9ROSI|nr:hypothetical protein Tsubulata_045852 [Turnera subulata]